MDTLSFICPHCIPGTVRVPAQVGILDLYMCTHRNKSAHMQSGNHYIDAFRCHRLCSLERRPRCFPCMCLSSAPGSPENIHLSVGKPASERSQGSSITSTRSCFMTTSSTKDAQSLSSNKAFLTVPIRKPYQAFLSPTAGRLIHIADSCCCFSSQRKSKTAADAHQS